MLKYIDFTQKKGMIFFLPVDFRMTMPRMLRERHVNEKGSRSYEMQPGGEVILRSAASHLAAPGRLGLLFRFSCISACSPCLKARC
jgi:hypothetical protein